VSWLKTRLRKWLGVQATTLRDPAEWFTDWLGGAKPTSGISVGDRQALGLSPYYAGLRAISETVGSLPLHVVQRDAGGTRRLAEDHPAYYLLHDAPNPDMTAMALRSTLIAHAIHYGNGYAEVEWDGYGRPRAIWPLSGADTAPELDDRGRIAKYKTYRGNGRWELLESWQVLHIPGLAFDGVQGHGLLKTAFETFGLHLAQEQYASRYFANGGHVSAVVETDQVLGDDSFKRLQAELQSSLGGNVNAHKVALLEAGLKLKPINLTHEQAQLIESRRFSVEEWARWLNIPPHKLRDLTHATFSNIEHQAIEYVTDTIRPWLVRVEQELNRKLFAQRRRFYAKHAVEGLLRGDVKARYEAYSIAISWGWLSQNEVRELEDLNPLPGDIGDDYWIQLNMQKLGAPPVAPAAPVEPEPEDQDEEPEPQALRPAVARQLRLIAEDSGVPQDEMDRRIAPRVRHW
jgi:HK97 family phage portal protein